MCLVENATGYRNLCRLITRRRFTQKMPFDFQAAVADLAEGLVVLTRDADLLAFWHAAGVTVAGAAPRRPDGAALRLRQTARRLGRPVVATPGSFFLEPADAEVHRLLRAIDRNTAFSRLAPADTAPPDARLAPPQVYARRFAVWPDTLRATHEIAERLTFHAAPATRWSCRPGSSTAAIRPSNSCGRPLMPAHGAVTATTCPNR